MARATCFGVRVSGSEVLLFRVQRFYCLGLGLMVYGFRFRVSRFAFRVQRFYCFGFRIYGFGFEPGWRASPVSGFGFRFFY